MFRKLLCGLAAFSVAGLAHAAQVGAQNPDISVNALFLDKNSNRGYDTTDADRNGVGVQEAEMQFASDVDPYWRFVGTFSMSQEPDEGQTAQTPPVLSTHWVFEPEEAYAETIDFNIATIRVGKFKAAMGKHNQLHTHAFPFIDAPIQNQVLLGDEGINDTGASAAILVPAPWYSELMFQVFSGQTQDDAYFNSAGPGNPVGLAHFRNLIDISDTLTGELGLSAATGENSYASSTNIYGADLTFKWRKDTGHAFIWQTEYLKRDYNANTQEQGQGVATWAQLQPFARWWFEARAEYFQLLNAAASDAAVSPFQRKQSAVVAFDPSEFSEIRVQYDHLSDQRAKDEHRAMLQFNYTIGAHPAHAY